VRGSPLARLLLLVYLALVVYASLYPLVGWREHGGSPFEFLAMPWPRHTLVFDVVSNVAGYAVLGLLTVLALRPHLRGAGAVLVAGTLGAGLSLLLEAAQIDRSTPAEELAAVDRIVRERFGFDAAAARILIAAARSELDASLEDWIFATEVRKGFTVAERAAIVGLLWEVIYADGRLARFEAALLKRLARELRVGKAASELARAQAFARGGRARRGDPGAGEGE